MNDDLDFLKEFPKNENGMHIVYDRFTFDNLFRLLLKADFDHEDALYFMLANCSMSALVFQERIYNKRYRKISIGEVLSPDLTVLKAGIVYDLIQVAQNHDKNDSEIN